MGHSDDTLCSTKHDNERELISMLTMEVWGSFGVQLIYYPVSYDTNYDRVFGEDGDKYITTSYENVMSYFTLPKENKVWSKFGIEGFNSFSMYISKEHFNAVTSNYIPKIGDIVLTRNDNKFYEITEVKEEAPTFMLSKQYAWELIVKQLKVEQEISISPSLSASPISSIYSVVDILDIKNTIDVEKEKVLYKPVRGEKPKNDPFGNW
jgi:hypothetical protein